MDFGINKNKSKKWSWDVGGGGAGRREAKRGRETEASSNDLWSFNAMHLFKFFPGGFLVHTNVCRLKFLVFNFYGLLNSESYQNFRWLHRILDTDIDPTYCNTCSLSPGPLSVLISPSMGNHHAKLASDDLKRFCVRLLVSGDMLKSAKSEMWRE